MIVQLAVLKKDIVKIAYAKEIIIVVCVDFHEKGVYVCVYMYNTVVSGRSTYFRQ